MNILNNILNKELKTSSFIMRSLSLVLLVFSTIAGILSFLFSKTFINAVFDLSNMMIMACVNSFKYAQKILIEYNIPYIFHNKLLLSLICISILSIIISYRFITLYKKGYKPYYFKYYNFSIFIEIVLSTILLNILFISFIKSFSISYGYLYDNIIRATFVTFCIVYPIIIFIIFNIKYSSFIPKWPNIIPFIKKDFNQSLMFFIILSFFIWTFGLFGIAVNAHHPLGYLIILNYLVLYYVLTMCACSFKFQKSLLPDSETMIEISNLKSLLYFNNNDTDFVEKTFNIKDEKDFYLMYVHITVLSAGVERTVKYKKHMKDYMGNNFKYKYYDLNFNFIATVN